MDNETYELIEAKKFIEGMISDNKRNTLNRFYETLPELICHYAEKVREIKEVDGIGFMVQVNHVYLKTFVNKQIKKSSKIYKKIQDCMEGIEWSIGRGNIETDFINSRDMSDYFKDHIIIH